MNHHESTLQRRVIKWSHNFFMANYPHLMVEREDKVEMPSGKSVTVYTKVAPIYWTKNEGKRTRKQRRSIQGMGLRKGIPDLTMPIRTKDYGGMYIELKHGANTPTYEQLSWKALLTSQKFNTIIAYTFEEATNAIMQHMEGIEE